MEDDTNTPSAGGDGGQDGDQSYQDAGTTDQGSDDSGSTDQSTGDGAPDGGDTTNSADYSAYALGAGDAGDQGAGSDTFGSLPDSATNSLAGGLGQIYDGVGEAASSLVYAGADAFMAGGELVADGIGHVSAAFHGLIGDEQGVHRDLRDAAAFGRSSAERGMNALRDLGLVDEPRSEGFDIERQAGLHPPSWLH